MVPEADSWREQELDKTPAFLVGNNLYLVMDYSAEQTEVLPFDSELHFIIVV